MFSILASFIGIAINIWVDTPGLGGGGGGSTLDLLDRFGNQIYDRAGSPIFTRV